MVKLVNRARMSTSTTGTGTITLGSAENGYQSFTDAGVPDGDVVRYVIEDGADWEIGTGTYTVSGTTLSRSVTESSNADAPLNLSGNSVVFIGAAAQDFSPTITLTGDASGSVTITDLENATLTVTVVDDSHNHVIANVDGLQADLDAKLDKSGGAMTGPITTNSTFDGVDIATRDAVLTSTTTTANAALPKSGGAMTGAITTNSTFDGVDVGARDAVLTTTTTTANAALPKAGGAMTGAITTNSTFDGRSVATDGAKLDNITVTQAVDLDQMEIDIAALANGMVYKGDWDASSSSFPGSGSAQIGWFYYVSVAGTVGGVSFSVGDNIVAIADNASTSTYASNWSKHDQTDAVTAVVGLNGSITKSGLLSALNVEDGADVTDATNVTAAGALMDSEVTNLAQVKAFDTTDYATAAQGSTADAALPKSGGAMTGAITTNSTFDGRDVATDGAKLDGIEAGATADQTNAEIRAAVEAATDSNVFTDADHTKLNGIEAGATADQTKADIDALGVAASTASTLASARNIALTGAVTGSTSFDGSGNVSITTTATSDPTVTLTGAVTGSGTMTNLGNVSIATTATADPTLTLSGDASGSATFTNLGNATLSVTVADDSHNHVISNVDGLQTALDGKLSTSGTAANSQLLDSLDSSQFLRSDAADSTSQTISFTGDIQVGDQIFHHGDTDTYMQFHAANQWRVVTGGTEMLEVNDSNVIVQSDLTVNGGDIVLGGTGRIQGVDTVSSGTDATNKTYVDTAISNISASPTVNLTDSGSGITAGKPVIVTSDGKAEQVANSSISTSISQDGTVVVSGATNQRGNIAYGNGHVVAVYVDSNLDLCSVSGVVNANGTVTWTSHRVQYVGSTTLPVVVYLEDYDRWVISFRNTAVSNRLYAIACSMDSSTGRLNAYYSLTATTAVTVPQDMDACSNGEMAIFCLRHSNRQKTQVIKMDPSTLAISMGSLQEWTSVISYGGSIRYDKTLDRVCLYYKRSNNPYFRLLTPPPDYSTAYMGSAANEVSAGSYTVSHDGPLSFDIDTSGRLLAYFTDSSGRTQFILADVTASSLSVRHVYQYSTVDYDYGEIVYDSPIDKFLMMFKDYTSDTNRPIKGVTIAPPSSGNLTSTVFTQAASTPANVDNFNYGHGVYAPEMNGMVYITYNNSQPTPGGNQVEYMVYRSAQTTTNLTAENFIGFAAGSYSANATATINLVGTAQGSQSGLTAGKKHYVQGDGALSTIAGTPSVYAGLATSASNIIVKG